MKKNNFYKKISKVKMRYSPISPNLFTQNRERFCKMLEKNSIAVFNANDIMPKNGDGIMPFVQNSDLFYLTGIDQEESILLLFPDAKESHLREILFLRETNEEIEIWEGHKYTKSEATMTSGIQTVYWLSDFDKMLQVFASQCENIYLNTNEHNRAVIEVETRDMRFLKKCRELYPLHSYKRSSPIMHHLRAVKSTFEVDILQTACDITNKGFHRVLNFVKPDVKEYEIEAEFAYEFLRNGSRGFAYTPIIASGYNACVLHYIANDQVCKAGEVILMDVGAEYAYYNADMTRCVPVSGRFGKRQADVYNAVLRVMKYAISILKVGNIMSEYVEAVGEQMQKELVDLKLLTLKDAKNNKNAYRKYFMHGTSHHLGLEVHDVGDKYRRFEEGMVFTCEPGIYIREENLGIRLENNLVITQNGTFDLMRDIPIEVQEIEDLMNK